MDVKQRIRAILAAESAAINAIVVDESFAQALSLLERCSGKIITTGMGKAGHAAKKFASLLCLTGSPAVFLHPGEALHGDLGLIGEGDVLVVFSASGRTREILRLVELGRKLGLYAIVSITSLADSALRGMSNLVLNMGIIDEPCPLGLAPTASIAVMCAISDALALVLMERKGFNERDFALRHSEGHLGGTAH